MPQLGLVLLKNIKWQENKLSIFDMKKNWKALSNQSLSKFI
jgi:hypothetical protein